MCERPAYSYLPRRALRGGFGTGPGRERDGGDPRALSVARAELRGAPLNAGAQVEPDPRALRTLENGAARVGGEEEVKVQRGIIAKTLGL